MRNRGIRIRVKRNDTLKIGSISYDLIVGKDYVFLSMTDDDCKKVKETYGNRLESFQVTTDTKGAFCTNIYRPIDRAKNFAKAAAKMPKKKREEIVEQSSAPTIEIIPVKEESVEEQSE